MGNGATKSRRALTDQYNVNMDTALLHPAVTALQDALSVYQSRSDRIDAAMVQSGIGSLFEAIGRYEPGVEKQRKPVEYLQGSAERNRSGHFPNIWGETQIQLGNALRVLSFWDKGTKDIEDAIAANREALKIYSKQESPMHWAEAQGQIAQASVSSPKWHRYPDDFHQSISILRQILNGYPRDRNPSNGRASNRPSAMHSWDRTISTRNQAPSIRRRPRSLIAPALRNSHWNMTHRMGSRPNKDSEMLSRNWGYNNFERPTI